MKRYFFILSFSLFLANGYLFSQRLSVYQSKLLTSVSQPTSSGYNNTGANINVVYHRANWTVNPNNSLLSISGSVTTYFKTIQSNVSVISFDFSKPSFNNANLSVKWHNITCAKSFPSSGNVNVLNITLPQTISAINTLDSIVINYSGTPLNNSGLTGAGFLAGTYTDNASVTQRYIITSSESYEDRGWWPCKSDMQDKIDSMDINVTVPWSGADTFWVASNGRLVDSAVTGINRTFKYSTRYPIASYLVCFAAAKYRRYYSSVQVGNTTVPVAWYLLAGKSSSYYNDALAAMRSMNEVVIAYSNKLGDYPFKLEKHGYYDGLMGYAGMENQTFSAISSKALASPTTLTHELMHQWFGDNVTFATWNDLWLAEGFARFGEWLAAELVPALDLNAYNRRSAIKDNALSLNNISTWIPNSNIGSSADIWNSKYASAVYERGAMIVSMLRVMSGDTKFFQALVNYQNKFGGGSANTDSLKNIFNDLLQVDLSGFFNDYAGGSGSGDVEVGGIGNPVYIIKWNSPSSNKLVLGVQSQNRSNGSNVSYFNGPVVVRATGSSPATQDTSIVFYDWGNNYLSYAGNGISSPVNGNILSYDLSFTPVSIYYDDSAYTLSTGSMLHDVSLNGYIWYGGTSSNWSDASNWSGCCGVPPDNADITIATTVNPPVLPASVAMHNLTINNGKFISIGNGTLTITGAVSGAGTITGSVNSNLVITGNAGTLNFTQSSSSSRSLQTLMMKPGSKALIASNAEIKNLDISAAANLTVATNADVIIY